MFLFARRGVVFGTLLGHQENLPNLIISLIVLVELTEDIGISSRETRVRSSLADFNGFHQARMIEFSRLTQYSTSHEKQDRFLRM